MLSCLTALQAQMPPGRIPGSGDPIILNSNVHKGKGKVRGILIDSASQTAVSFATVALINLQSNKPVDGTVSDEEGKFEITKVPGGEYVLEYSFVGYRTSRSESLEMKNGSVIDMGKVFMVPETRVLEEVTVLGMQDLIDEKVDRLVYNAEKDVTTKGGNASDVLRKVPLLTVDLDGNVSLKGSQNVKVLINNKPSTIVASSVADALQQIPADVIKSVEVITSPSARYDAEGVAGIVNIITKKNSLEGVTLTTDLGAGNRGAHLGLYGSSRKGKMGFNIGGYLRANYNINGNFKNIQTTLSPEGRITTTQSADTKNEGLFGSYNLTWDYDIDSTTFLTAGIRYSVSNATNSQFNMFTQTYLPNASGPLSTKMNIDTEDLSGTLDANFAYTKVFKPSKELSILGLYSRNDRKNSFVSEILDVSDNSLIGGWRNINPNYNQESIIQIDYQAPVSSNQLIEMGGKIIFRNVSSDYKSFPLRNGDYLPDARNPSNVLSYDQGVTAGYFSHTLTTKKQFSIKTGLRYEYTSINAEYKDGGEELNADIPDYGLLVPSINISKTFKGGNTVKLSYNRRIQRPGIQFLNPNINSANPNNITVGNPYLFPELADNLELGMSGQAKSAFVYVALFGRRTGSMITSVRDTLSQIVNGENTSIISTSYENIGREEAVGVNFFTNATFFSKLQIGLGGTAYQTCLSNNDPKFTALNSGFTVSGYMSTTFTLDKGWAIQGFSGGRGRQVRLQGYQSGFIFYSLGVRKDFKNKKGSFGIAGENFFNHPFKTKTEVTSP
ncbi:MAG: TonB-dependent receptor, partial [Cyclobacteriaceae bacterium]